jgi:hypothetical protein
MIVAARTAMITTTINTSTSVKPLWRRLFVMKSSFRLSWGAAPVGCRPLIPRKAFSKCQDNAQVTQFFHWLLASGVGDELPPQSHKCGAAPPSPDN